MTTKTQNKTVNALCRLYLETADYIHINHLGEVHHNQSMQIARDTLKQIIEELETSESVLDSDNWEMLRQSKASLQLAETTNAIPL